MLSHLEVETRDIYDTPDVHENCNTTDGSHIMSKGPSETYLDPDGLDIISNDPDRSVQGLGLVPSHYHTYISSSVFIGHSHIDRSYMLS